MKNIVLGVLLILFCSMAQAKLLNDTYVYSSDASLTKADLLSLNTQLSDLDKSGKAVMGIIIVPSLNGKTPAEAGLELAEEEKLGHQGKDDGILLILFLAEHSINISTGRGVSEYITDAKSMEFIESMRTQLQKGSISVALVDVVSEVALLTKDSTITVDNVEKESYSSIWLLIGFFLSMVFGVGYFMWESDREDKRKEKLRELARKSKEEQEEKGGFTESTDKTYASSKSIVVKRTSSSIAKDVSVPPAETFSSFPSSSSGSSYSPSDSSSYSPSDSSSSYSPSDSSSSSSYDGGGSSSFSSSGDW